MTKDRVRATVETNIIEILPEITADLILPGTSLRDLGANSIDRMDVVFGAVNDLGLDVPSNRLAGVQDIEALVDALWSCASSQERIAVDGDAP